MGRFYALAAAALLCFACDIRGYTPPTPMLWNGQPVRLLFTQPKYASRWTVKPESITCKKVGDQAFLQRVQPGEVLTDADQVLDYAGACLPVNGTCSSQYAPKFGVKTAANFDAARQCFVDTDLPGSPCVLGTNTSVQVFDAIPAGITVTCPPASVLSNGG